MTMANTIEEMADNYVNGFHPSIKRMCNESYTDGANALLEMLYHIAYKEDWITNPKDGVRRFFEIYRELKGK